MNSITRTLLFLSGNCLASWEQIRIAMEQLEAKVAANGTQVNIQSADGSMPPLNREFGGLISSFMVDISQYGCWCYLDGNYQGNARGAPVDWIDQQCKRLVNGYKCAGMDAVVRGESCEAHTVDYTAYDYFSAWDPIDVECAANNADLCAQAACIIEGKFVMDFFPQFFGGITYDPQFQHPEVGGTFDTQVECPYGGSGKQADTDRECCGEYISGRAPFKTRNRECCGNTVINPLHMQCCAGGVSQPVGQVC